MSNEHLARNRLVSVPDVRYTAAQKYGHQGGEGYRHWHGGCRPSLGPQWEGDLFVSGRVAPNGYSFAIPTGKYQVTIGICEGDVHVVGQRVFDVLVDGKVVAEDVDPIAQAGYKEPMMLAASVHLEDERPLAISFRQKSDRAPIVSAIWVTPLPHADKTDHQVRCPASPTNVRAVGSYHANLISWPRPKDFGITGFLVRRR